MEARKVVVPGDISSAAFFIVAGLIVPNSELLIKNVGINPTRTGLITALQQMNGQIEVINRREEVGEPVADLLIKSSDLKAATIKGDIIPTLIDEVPALTVAALFAEGETVIMDAAELRVKESDRIAVLAEELQKIGGQVQELPDGLRIRGGRALRGSLCSSHHDHRIAMALAVAGLRTEGKMQIADFECTAISYPGFAEDLKRLCS
jgi:3-phosphoshikimate 1-carboxyvinyltransferase